MEFRPPGASQDFFQKKKTCHSKYFVTYTYECRECARPLFSTNQVLFFCPTHTHTISSFMGISSRPFVGENGFRLVPQNRVSTENAVGCLILLDQVLLIAPHIHTASAPPWEFPTGFVQKQVEWISQLLRNPLDLLLNKSCWKFPFRSGCCVHVWGKEKNFVDKKQAAYSILCAHTVLEH